MHMIKIHSKRIGLIGEDVRSLSKNVVNTFDELNITDSAALYFLPQINPLFFVSKTYMNPICFQQEAEILQTIQNHFYNGVKKTLPFTPLLLESDESILTNYISYCGSLLRGEIKESKLIYGNKHIKDIVEDYDVQINDIFNTLIELNIGCELFSDNWKNTEPIDIDDLISHKRHEEYGLHRRGIEFTYDEYNNKLMIIDVENWSLNGKEMQVWAETKRLLLNVD